MIVNKANISAFFVNIKTTFNGALKDAPTHWQKIAMKIHYTGKSKD